MDIGRTQPEKLPPLEQGLSGFRHERYYSTGKRRGHSKPKEADNRSLTVEMLGAGLNPKARIANYSKLANDPALLMKTRFKKPPLANTRFPPVLDMYSRTMAAPMTSERHYVTPSVRIASFYNPDAKSLIIDPEIRGIRVVPEEAQNTLVANVDPMLPQLASSDNKRIVAFGNDTDSLKKDYTQKRYMHYIENEISTDVIANIREY